MNTMRHCLALLVLLSTIAPLQAQNYDARVARVLKSTPLIDGHNDWAEVLRERAGDGRWHLDLTHGLELKPVASNTDIARLRKGRVGSQFWSVYVSASLPGPE